MCVLVAVLSADSLSGREGDAGESVWRVDGAHSFLQLFIFFQFWLLLAVTWDVSFWCICLRVLIILSHVSSVLIFFLCSAIHISVISVFPFIHLTNHLPLLALRKPAITINHEWSYTWSHLVLSLWLQQVWALTLFIICPGRPFKSEQAGMMVHRAGIIVLWISPQPTTRWAQVSHQNKWEYEERGITGKCQHFNDRCLDAVPEFVYFPLCSRLLLSPTFNSVSNPLGRTHAYGCEEKLI